MNNNDKKESLTLEILQAIEQNNDVTQRHLASHLGVALGLANSYLKRCVRKGLVKIQHVPANRYLYYLTPKGFAEKSRLTAKYLSISFDFYRNASSSITDVFHACEKAGHSRLILCGLSELTEIATIRVQEHPLEITGIFDPDSDKKKALHLPVWNKLAAADQFDACVVTALNDPLSIYELLHKQIDTELIFAPSILGINEKNKVN
ncbi:MAG: winged helix-turn-helix transcriptional regulator [Gammaproteobacteria bacterium]|nr:winged helix-turn-helix transcriptional regulator [Gammaproteobacteria bacterium]NIN61675.1 winged helix-turn-helix transcriptional regulator [Gammaproteobacteria bacterium]NIO63469.1 winged helix-turn-helix transcriptional regulator [Gammaproteobacteria bacterium]NIQ19403.1 winged helix-turn-helix transcriptional regulator [Gammaproteobacteria bacterium]NIT05504.1 winged helix-turn-helix transcriptional regulator [Gammaproteobacteria bacterium]